MTYSLYQITARYFRRLCRILQIQGGTLAIVIGCFVLALTWSIYEFHFPLETADIYNSLSHRKHSSEGDPGRQIEHREYTQTLVVASTRKEDTRWILHSLPNVQHAIYVADDPSAALHPPENKGNEAMIYLTYIIDHYANLSDITIFIHAEQSAWHNNDLFDYDMARMVSALSPAHVTRAGYFNLRCHPESGCPDHIQPFSQGPDRPREEPFFQSTWAELHGDGVPVPEVLSTACCAQFAASRDAIQAVPLERWEHYRAWLQQTPLDSATAGRIWEFTWHYVLTGGEAVVCPRIEHCYCDGYGLCFESHAEIQSWLTMNELQAVTMELIKDFAERGRSTEKLNYHKEQRIERPLNKWLYEAKRRGQDPYTRALLSGRADSWKEGDAF